MDRISFWNRSGTRTRREPLFAQVGWTSALRLNANCLFWLCSPQGSGRVSAKQTWEPDNDMSASEMHLPFPSPGSLTPCAHTLISILVINWPDKESRTEAGGVAPITKDAAVRTLQRHLIAGKKCRIGRWEWRKADKVPANVSLTSMCKRHMYVLSYGMTSMKEHTNMFFHMVFFFFFLLLHLL